MMSDRGSGGGGEGVRYLLSRRVNVEEDFLERNLGGGGGEQLIGVVGDGGVDAPLPQIRPTLSSAQTGITTAH